MAKFYVQNISGGEPLHVENFGYGIELEAASFVEAAQAYDTAYEFDAETDVLVALNVASFRELPATVATTFTEESITDLSELE